MQDNTQIKIDSIKTSLATKLAQYRQSRNLSQTQMANLCQISQSKVSKIERGEFDAVSIDFLMRLNFKVDTGFKLKSLSHL